MNRMEKYEYVRNLPQEDFELLKYIYNAGHTGVFEKIATGVKVAIAALLAYISYKTYDTNLTLAGAEALSAIFMVFNKKMTSFIPSLITAVKVTKDPEIRAKYAERLIDMIAKIKKDHINNLDKKIKELDEQDEDNIQ